MDSENFAGTERKAEKVLLKNIRRIDINGDHYRYVIPSADFYVHQWNWDSVMHAMGLIHTKHQYLAFEELRFLFSGQWKNGFIPHINFDPQQAKYFPGIDFWRTGQFTKKKAYTSGITHPPLIAVGVHYVYRHAKDRKAAEKFLDFTLPRVIRYHEYLKKFRDPENSGLLTIIHPWESGMDNSPRWDSVLMNMDLDEIPQDVKKLVAKHRSDDKIGTIAHRPRPEDYYRYIALIWKFRNLHWNYEKIVKESPFAVKGIVFTSIWVWANEQLADLLEDLGRFREAEKYMSWAEQSRKALSKTWDKKQKSFFDIDVSGGNHRYLRENTIATFVPILAKVADEKKLNILLDKLHDKDQFATPLPVPSVAVGDFKFDLTRYWRGPTWPIMNLFLIEGLSKYPKSRKCLTVGNELLLKTLNMIREYGFYEYYAPIYPHKKLDTPALGFSNFSWTSAIFIYLFNKFHRQK